MFNLTKTNRSRKLATAVHSTLNRPEKPYIDSGTSFSGDRSLTAALDFLQGIESLSPSARADAIARFTAETGISIDHLCRLKVLYGRGEA